MDSALLQIALLYHTTVEQLIQKHGSKLQVLKDYGYDDYSKDY